MKSVLFVDDNSVLSRLSCDILRRQGYRAVPVYSAAEALAVLEQQEFDLVVTDLRMEGMDGLELARVVHGRKPYLPIILVTAYGPVECEHARTCLPKDGLFPRLLEHIESCFSETAAKD